MPYTHLDLTKLRKYDENALCLLFDTIARLWKRALKSVEISRIYREGIKIIFTGDGFHPSPELNYACFYLKASKNLPLKMTVRCFASTNTSHKEIALSDDTERLIVAGIVTNCSFNSFSSTWLTQVNRNSAHYYLGAYLNNMLLRIYNIKKPLSYQTTR